MAMIGVREEGRDGMSQVNEADFQSVACRDGKRRNFDSKMRRDESKRKRKSVCVDGKLELYCRIAEGSA